MNQVGIIKTPDYEYSTVYRSVCEQFEQLSLDSMIQTGQKIVIKPNLLMKRTPEEATTTHPMVVRAIINRLEQLGVTDITVADSPGGIYQLSNLQAIYRASGMTQAVEGTCAKLNTDVTSGTRKAEYYTRVSFFELITPILEADLVISVAKLKTHGMTMMSGGVKNLFGCVPGLLKPEFHCRFPQKEDFCEMLVDLCECVRPAVTFVDAVVSMEGDGPSGGTPRQTGYLFAAKNPYALDSILARFIGFDENEIETIRAAKRRGLCPSYEEITCVGDIQDFKAVDDFVHPKSKGTDFSDNVPKLFQKPVRWIVSKVANPRPIIRVKDCVGCGKCKESCPQKTITLVNRKAGISYDRCIRCYCCHEMCPVKAIDIRRIKLFDLSIKRK